MCSSDLRNRLLMGWCQELLSKEGNVKVSASVFTKQVPLALSNVAVHKALKDSAYVPMVFK